MKKSLSKLVWVVYGGLLIVGVLISIMEISEILVFAITVLMIIPIYFVLSSEKNEKEITKKEVD